MIKYGYTKNTVLEKLISLTKPSLSQDNNNRRQESNFLGRCSKFWSIPSENSEKKQENWELWYNQEPPKISAARWAVRQLKTKWQDWISLKRYDGIEMPDCAGGIEEICWPLWNPLQKRRRHWEREGPSRTERIHQVTFQIGHSWEFSASKYTRCSNAPCTK